MATLEHAIFEHDVVGLGEPFGSWATGTIGAVISVYDDAALVEISDLDGKTLDTIRVPVPLLEIKRR